MSVSPVGVAKALSQDSDNPACPRSPTVCWHSLLASASVIGIVERMTNAEFRLGEWRAVADRVYVAVAEPESVNIGLVLGTDAALVIDTGSSPEQGAAIRAAVAEFSDLPLLGTVITHAHFDHAFGIAGFDGLATIGHESLTEELRGFEAAAKATELGVDPSALQLPSQPIAVADVVELGGNRVAEIAYLGPAHSTGDLAVSIADAGVVFAGDLIETASSPWYGSDSVPDQWPWAIHQLATLAGPDTRVIPGHGDPTDRESVLAQRDLLDSVRTEIERLGNAGVAAKDALASGDWPIPADHVAGGITAGYARPGSSAQSSSAQSGPSDTAGRTTLPLA